jgi:hypothetical protein
MTQSKKYTCRAVQDGTNWTAEILRRVTAKETRLTKAQDGFSTESEAQAWGEKEIATLLKNQNLSEQKKRYSKEREQDL